MKIFNAFWNACRESFCSFDKNLDLTEINRIALARIKKKKRDVIGKNILEIFLHLKKSDHYHKYLDVLRTGKPVFIRNTPDPFRKNHFLRIFAFKVLDGLGMIISDITESYLSEAKLKSSFQILRSLSYRNQALREEEMQHIAREIHDEMAPTLTTLKMDLFWILSKLKAEGKPEPRVEKKITEMADLIDKTTSSIRKISTELRPALLDDLGLLEALEWQVQEYQKRFGIKIKIKIECGGLEFSRDLSLCIFRIFQEAFANVQRHAKATRVFVGLKHIPAKNMVVLKVKDNGLGIRAEEIKSAGSFGLIGMKERLVPYDGRLEINGIPNRGTTVTAFIPLTEETVP